MPSESQDLSSGVGAFGCRKHRPGWRRPTAGHGVVCSLLLFVSEDQLATTRYDG